MPTVYVTQEPEGKNILSAADFGDLKILLPNKLISFSTVPAVRRIRQIMDYKPDDSLLLIGDPVVIGIACSIAAEQNAGRVRVLRWDRQERRYMALNFDIYGREIDG